MMQAKAVAGVPSIGDEMKPACCPLLTHACPHAWLQAEAVVGVPRIDEDILQETVRMGFDRDMLVDSIRSRFQNKATVTYYLMADNRRRLPSSGYLRSEMSEAQNAALTAVPLQQAVPSGGSIPQQRLVAERRWWLGTHGRGHPSSLMAELYRVLAALGVAWKKTAPYNLKCRKVVVVQTPRTSMSDDDGDERLDGLVGDSHMDLGSHHAGKMMAAAAPLLDGQARVDGTGAEGAGGAAGGAAGAAVAGDGLAPGESVMKFECQMYKVREDEYLIDIQRLCGDTFSFMEVVSRICLEMRI